MRKMGAKRTLTALVGACLLGSGACPVPAAANAPGIDIPPGGFTAQPVVSTPSHDSLVPNSQAGAHPDMTISLRMCYPSLFDQSPTACPDGTIAQNNATTDDLKSFTLTVPPGVLGNPNAVSHCSTPQFIVNDCPASSQIGVAAVDTTGAGAGGELPQDPEPIEIYNLLPGPGEAARLGNLVHGKDYVCGGSGWFPVPTVVSVHTTNDVTIAGKQGSFYSQAGSPIDRLPLDLKERTNGCSLPTGQPITVGRIDIRFFGQTSNGANFWVNPTSCRPATLRLDVESEGDEDSDVNLPVDPFTDAEGQPAEDHAFTSFTPTGCENVPFTPSVDIDTKETNRAGAPSAYEIGIHLDDSEADLIHQAHLKRAEVSLPQGVGLNAAAALELDGCTQAQFGLGSEDSPHCPASSKIGDVSVTTPVLDSNLLTANIEPLSGAAYFGQPNAPGPPTAANPWKLYQVIEGPGLRIKLSGNVTVDPQTGRIKTVFEDLPQTPFTDFRLKLRGGDHAILQNPLGCGDHQLDVALTPHSSSAPTNVTATVDTSFDGAGAPCPAPMPFSPGFSVSADDTSAGAFTNSHLSITRPAGNQLIQRLRIALAPGMVGSLANVPLCSAGAAQAGSCPESSRIGRVRTTVGDGGDPLGATGTIYLAEPLVAGDAASLSIVVPAKVGPIDLDKVVVINNVRLRPSDAGIDAVGDLPTSIGGIPLSLRDVQIDIDRQSFWLNPTSCAPQTVVAELGGDQGSVATPSAQAEATNCHLLPFNPRLRLIATGNEAKKSDHPGIRAIVTQRPGEANIASASVLLPQILRPELPAIQRSLCTSPQLASNACPPLARVGQASALTPLLPTPLTGPVYLVQDPDPVDPLPRLVVRLGGMVSFDLVAANKIQGVRTLNLFQSVPDVPVSHFQLDIRGGRDGILKNFGDLCQSPDHADATFHSHAGGTVSSQPELELDGCQRTAAALAIRTSKARLRRRKIKVRLSCTRDRACVGRLTLRSAGKVRTKRRGKRKRITIGRKRFSIPGHASRTIAVSVRKRALRAFRLNRRLRLRATTSLDGQTFRKTILVRTRRNAKTVTKRHRR